MDQDPGAGSTRRIRGDQGYLQLVELPALRIVIVEGPGAGTRLTLPLSTIRIGSAAENDLVLRDDAVSRFHARVSRSSAGVVLTDLGSTNGTFVNGVRTREAVLEPAQRIRIGETVLEVELRTKEYHAAPSEEDHLGEMIGASTRMREVYGLIRAVAPSPATILVCGESGTGKELAARAIHEASGRTGPLVVFDCAGTSPELMRSELFGHEKGAFTGADRAREGAFRRAHRGTLFIDELGELPLSLQPLLLRVLETREVQPVGSDRTVPVDVRVVAATHRNLEEMVRADAFRRDLFHRLAVVRIDLPPLRERPEDVPLIVSHLARKMGLTARFGEPALRRLVQHHWPGNIRALRNAVEAAALLRPGQEVRPEDIRFPEQHEPVPAARDEAGTAAAPRPASRPESATGGSLSLDDMERKAIAEALERTGGNKAAAARLLGIGLTTLKRKLKEPGD